MFEGGPLSLLPIILTLILAFLFKDAIFALFIGCIIGVLMVGLDPATGFSKLAQQALGNADFIWVALIEIFIGILISLFYTSGVVLSFSDFALRKVKSRRAATGLTGLLGVFVFFSDYFSPLFVGTVMRPITDKHRVPREKLAFLLDTTASPICTLLPFSAWGAYMSGLLIGYGPIDGPAAAMRVVISSIPYNLYSLIIVVLSLLIAFQIIPDYGPMKKAEERAITTGKVLRDGAVPLISKELEEIRPPEGRRGNVLLHLIMPILLVIGIAIGTFILIGSAKTLEAFIVATLYLAVVLGVQKYFKDVREFTNVSLNGIKGVLPAIIILALAYCINTVTRTLKAQEFIISVMQGWVTPTTLLVVTFITACLISYFTGTSWGTYAILTPFVLPLAFQLTGGEITPLIYATVAAIFGGGVFGDHVSPVSDTTVLASFASACDHVDHVVTQLPYGLTAAIISLLLYTLLGIVL
ncbi:MAG: transporter [Crenarchaeota archaeon]|nr:transporter [Thermoproteota archaeon]MCR8487666.1 transporter [Thermoproteota archaeon]